MLNYPFSIASPAHFLSRRKAIDLTANNPRSSCRFNGNPASVDFFEKTATHTIPSNRRPQWKRRFEKPPFEFQIFILSGLETRMCHQVLSLTRLADMSDSYPNPFTKEAMQRLQF